MTEHGFLVIQNCKDFEQIRESQSLMSLDNTLLNEIHHVVKSDEIGPVASLDEVAERLVGQEMGGYEYFLNESSVVLVNHFLNV